VATHSARHRRLTKKRPSFVLQSIAFPRGFSRARAQRWARRHGYRGAAAERSSKGAVRVRQLPPRRFQRLRTITLGKGIRATGGPLRNPVDIDPPDGGLDEIVGYIPDLGQPAIKTIAWRELTGPPGARSLRRRSRRVRLAADLADAVRVSRAVRDYARHRARAGVTTRQEHASDAARKRGTATPRAPSLSTFVRRQGGIVVPPAHPLRGEAKRFAGLSRTRGVVKLTGRGKLPGHMAELAAEAGYPIEKGAETQILEALEREALGQAVMRPIHANPRRLTARSSRRYKQGARPGQERSKVATFRTKSGKVVSFKSKKSKGSGKRKGGSRKRKRNPIGADEVALLAVNPRHGKRRKHNPTSLRSIGGSLIGSLTPTRKEIALGLGMAVADFSGNLVQRKFFKKEPTSLLSRVGACVGGAIGARLVAKGMRMIPVKAIQDAAPEVHAMAWPGGVFRAIKTIAIPAIPEGKIKATLSDWGVSGGLPYSPARMYVMDADNGQSFELDGCTVKDKGVRGTGGTGAIAGEGVGESDDVEDLDGDDDEDLDGAPLDS
jgi:hypothetical protein